MHYGPSGSGKSTSFKMLMDDYHVQNGKIKCFSKAGNETMAKDNISLVLQDSEFFTDSILENLVIGQGVEIEKMHEVCKNCSI